MSARLTLFLLGALVLCALLLITTQHKARKLFVELQKEQASAKQLEVEWGQLQLEQGTWATHSRIERMAMRELQMRAPVAERTVVIPQMVVPAQTAEGRP